jgi:hypothetical protein
MGFAHALPIVSEKWQRPVERCESLAFRDLRRRDAIASERCLQFQRAVMEGIKSNQIG